MRSENLSIVFLLGNFLNWAEAVTDQFFNSWGKRGRNREKETGREYIQERSIRKTGTERKERIREEHRWTEAKWERQGEREREREREWIRERKREEYREKEVDKRVWVLKETYRGTGFYPCLDFSLFNFQLTLTKVILAKSYLSVCHTSTLSSMPNILISFSTQMYLGFNICRG